MATSAGDLRMVLAQYGPRCPVSCDGGILSVWEDGEWIEVEELRGRETFDEEELAAADRTCEEEGG